jgi:hypothetical protein
VILVKVGFRRGYPELPAHAPVLGRARELGALRLRLHAHHGIGPAHVNEGQLQRALDQQGLAVVLLQVDEGRPLVAVYRAALLPDPASTAATWRRICRARAES